MRPSPVLLLACLVTVVACDRDDTLFDFDGDGAVDDLDCAPEGGQPYFGASVAGGADVTGDGVPDVIVGAPVAEANRGVAYLFTQAVDMGNAIMGITLGAVILGARRNVDIAGTPMGEVSSLSGIVHLVFGSISAIITLPEILVGLVGVIATAERDRPLPDIRFAISPTGFSLSDRF